MNVDANTISFLKRVVFLFNKNSIDWVLFGGVNLTLKGVVDKYTDVDILISNDDLEKVYKLFLDKNPSPIKDFASGEARCFGFKADGVEPHFCAEYGHGFYYKKAFIEGCIELFDIGNVEIPTLKLDSEVDCYDYIGRPKRAQLIKSFIEK